MRKIQNKKKSLHLALDLVDRVLWIFNVGHVSWWDPTRIGEQWDGVVKDAHEGYGGENEGVHDSRRSHETKPAVYEDEESWKVNVSDDQNDEGYR